MKLSLLFVALVAAGCIGNECGRACEEHAQSCADDASAQTQCLDRCEAELSAKGGACTATADTCDADTYVSFHCLAL